MRINDPEWYPCYLNPTFEEILELAQSSWDTCRVLINPDNDDIVIASGHGNTHTSINNLYRIHLGKKRYPYVDSFILYHENRIALVNLEDVGGRRQTRLQDCLDLFGKHEAILKDLIRESDLAL